jgi:hypothetical protein
VSSVDDGAASGGGAFDPLRTGTTGSGPDPAALPGSDGTGAPALTTGRAGERPAVLGRTTWAARPPAGPTWAATSLRAAIVHHTGSGESSTYAAEDVPAMLRAMQAYHMDVNGWLDLGYNIVIDRFGRIWEGRAGGPDALTIGAHAEGMNTGSVGVALLGDFRAAAPSPEAVDALGRFVAWTVFRHGADPARPGILLPRTTGLYPALTPVSLPRIVGHGDVNATGCPGDVAPLLPAIRADVEQRYLALVGSTTGLADAAVPLVADGVPTVGDFDKDGDDDVFWYRRGDRPDQLWRSAGRYGYVVSDHAVPDGGGTNARITRLDWDGDGATDLLVSTPGRTTVTLVRGVPGGTVAMSTLNASGDAVPVAGDFDGDGDDDVLFRRDGSTVLPLFEFNGGTGATVTNLTLTGGPYRPVVGDFDGDLRADVLWYGPGGTTDLLWVGQGARRFTTRSVTMGGDHRPVVADLDGDQRHDIVWGVPGTAGAPSWSTAANGPVPVWFGGSTFRPSSINTGRAQHLVLADVDGGGADDVVTVTDSVATVTLDRPVGPWELRRGAVPSGAVPVPADFDGDGRREIWWWVDGRTAAVWRTI